MNDSAYEPIKTLAYKCIQWGDGEITGYNMTMLENLLPMLMEPIWIKKSEVKEMLEKYRLKVEEGKKIFEANEEENAKTINYYRDWAENYKQEKERLETESKTLKINRKKEIIAAHEAGQGDRHTIQSRKTNEAEVYYSDTYGELIL